MKSIFIGIVLTVIVAAIAWGVTKSQKTTSADAFSSENSVRLN